MESLIFSFATCMPLRAVPVHISRRILALKENYIH